MKVKQIIISTIALSIILFSFNSCSSDNASDTTENESTEYVQPATLSPSQVTELTHSYNALTDDAVKELYVNIDKTVILQSSVPFTVDGEITEKQLNQAICAYKNDHPDVFWLKNDTTYYYQNESTTVNLSFSMTFDEREEALNKFEKAVDNIASKAPENGSDYEKELYVNNYLTDNCTYDKGASKADEVIGNENDAYGALIDKKAVCEGYARAFQLLCNKIGVDCVTVSGNAEGVNHAWNCVRLDGDWYQVDVTWNDVDDDKLVMKNDYLNLTDEQMYKDHSISPLFDECSDEEYENIDSCCNVFVPICSSTTYNYYRRSCVILKNVDDSDELVNAMANSAKENSIYFSFVVDDSLDYTTTIGRIIDDGYLSEWISRANQQNYYSPEINSACRVYKKENNRVLTCKFEYY